MEQEVLDILTAKLEDLVAKYKTGKFYKNCWLTHIDAMTKLVFQIRALSGQTKGKT